MINPRCNNPEGLVIIGKIGAPYGVKGWLHVRSFTEPASNIGEFATWRLYLSDQTKCQVMQVEQLKMHNNHYVAKLIGITEREVAATFTNCQIAVNRQELPELKTGEYYWSDLLGMTVYNKDGSKLGKIVDFLATGANDVLVVQEGNIEHLIPYVYGIYVLTVDVIKKEVQVAWNEEY